MKITIKFNKGGLYRCEWEVPSRDNHVGVSDEYMSPPGGSIVKFKGTVWRLLSTGQCDNLAYNDLFWP
jgi:hypothetical protein